MAGAGNNGKRPKGRAGAGTTESPSASTGALSFVIPSDFTAGHEVQKRILDGVASHGFNDQSQFAIKLALEEAMINAIKHGNKLDPKKKVTIKAKVTPKMCQIVIEDQGPGFKRTDVPDPTAEENLEKCSGRGILLMEAYMSEVAWDRGGRRVTMVKKNDEDTLPRK